MPTRSRALIVCTLIAVILASAAPAEASISPAQQRMYNLIQHTREAHHVHTLRWNARVARIAQHHSERMALLRKLFHSKTVGSRLSKAGCSTWGEAVGMSSQSLKAIRTMWLKDATHRAILLDPHYRRVGVGVVRSHGAWWVTADFCT